MRRAAGLAWLWLALAGAVWAQAVPDSIRIQVRTQPPGAQVSQVTTATLRHQERVLGNTGPGSYFLLERNHHYRDLNDRISFRVLLQGYEPYDFECSVASLVNQTEPVAVPSQEIALKPVGWGHYLRSPALGLGLAAMAVSGILLWRRRQLDEHLREHQAWLESRIVRGRERDPLLGKQMGRYLLCEVVGRGGMATVYRVERLDHVEKGHELAMKVLNNHSWFLDSKFKERFHREATVCARLRHPNIVTLYEAAEEGHEEYLYLVMELVRGQTLRERIPPTGMPLSQALELLEPLATALGYAHAQGVVHRDLKPENIMVTDDGRLKIMDFGLARFPDAAKVTETGGVLGTLAYMSPEQIYGQEATPAADQYAVGIIVYELLTGHQPFDRESPMAVVLQHIHEPPPSLRQLRPDLPAAADEAVLRMLAKEAPDRFPSLKDAIAALRAASHA